MQGLDDLLIFWFNNPRVWFEATLEDDDMIRDRYNNMLCEANELDLQPILNESNHNTLLGLTVLFDQISRHIFRSNPDNIKPFHRKALQIAEHMLDHDLDLLCTPEQRAFVLLPLRHTFEILYLERVIKRIKSYEPDHPSYARFLKATLYSYSTLLVPTIQPTEQDVAVSEESIFQILDVKSVRNLTVKKEISTGEAIYKAFSDSMKKIPRFGKIIVSLSGGVDSMVVLHNLVQLSQNHTKFIVIAVHINYNNRNTCQTEVNFLARWCGLLQVPLYVRHIWELKRDRSHNRDLYEKVTRRFRFDMYRRFECPVVLGHNQDDAVENIFANVRKARSLNNLKGMTEIGAEEGVSIIRPMLDIPKSEIYDFADRYLIPHLEDSTPKWSDRGKMRDHLIPSLNSFDPNIIHGLLGLADYYQEIFQILDQGVIVRFYSQVDVTQKFIPLKSSDPEVNFGFVFWKAIIIKFFKDLNQIPPSNKSISSMIDRINNGHYGKIAVTKSSFFDFTNSGLKLISMT